MKKLTIILLCLISFNSYSTSIKEALIANNILNQFIEKKITANYYIEKLKKCSDYGNKACITFLGSFYLTIGSHQDFTKAYQLLSKASDDFNEEPIGGKIANFYLGKMYYLGWGVLQSDNKAIYFLSKSARTGYKSAAYSIAMIYALNEIINEAKTKNDTNNKYKSKNVEYFAWLKIADALPVKFVQIYQHAFSSGIIT